jgi:hypothetical protein
MRRYRLLVVVLTVSVLATVAIRFELRAEARKKREAAYQSALEAYSRNLRPGLTRKEVETYFRAGGIKFGQMGWVEERPEERTAFADLVKVGEEDAPWYCSERDISIAFEFAAMEPHRPWVASDTDVLKKVLIFRSYGGCL